VTVLHRPPDLTLATWGHRARPLLAAGREVALIAVLYGLYRSGRMLATGHDAIALRHAARIRDVESWLHLPGEAALQGLVASPGLLRAANVYYVSVHFPVMIAFIVWAYVTWTRPDYRWARNVLAVQTLMALVVHMAYPLAPPRMFPQWGFEDSMTVIGPSAYEGAAGDLANQFAAMPSLHVGWAVFLAVALSRTGHRRLALVAAVHAAVTTFVVVVTANHWWLDGLAGVALLVVALAVVPGRTRHRGACHVSSLVPRAVDAHTPGRHALGADQAA
jgi:hypothetical protein